MKISAKKKREGIRLLKELLVGLLIAVVVLGTMGWLISDWSSEKNQQRMERYYYGNSSRGGRF